MVYSICKLVYMCWCTIHQEANDDQYALAYMLIAYASKRMSIIMQIKHMQMIDFPWQTTVDENW